MAVANNVVLLLLGLLPVALVVWVALGLLRAVLARRNARAADRADLGQLLRDALPESVAAKVADLIRPSILLRPTSVPPRTLPAGRSRVGGEPDLPPEVDWPVRAGRPMALLAQINCAELAACAVDSALPERGWLWFFYDAEGRAAGSGPTDRGSWAVIYFSGDETALEPGEPPGDLPGPPRYALHEVSFAADMTLPAWDSMEMTALQLEPEATDDYLEALDALAARRGGTLSRMLGHPDAIHGGRLNLECQLVSNGIDCGDPSGWRDPRVAQLAEGAADWLLLLQLD